MPDEPKPLSSAAALLVGSDDLGVQLNDARRQLGEIAAILRHTLDGSPLMDRLDDLTDTVGDAIGIWKKTHAIAVYLKASADQPN